MNSIILKSLQYVNLKPTPTIINDENYKNDFIDNKLKKNMPKMSKLKIRNNSTNNSTNNIENINPINKITKIKILPHNRNVIIFPNSSISNMHYKITKQKKFVTLDKQKKFVTLNTPFELPNKKLSIEELDKIKYYGITVNLKKNQRIDQNNFYSIIIKNPNIILLDLFPQIGLLSCLINNKLNNPFNHIVYEPRVEHIKFLTKNKTTHNSFFSIFSTKVNLKELKINTLLLNISELTFGFINEFLKEHKIYIDFNIDIIIIEFNDKIDNKQIETLLIELLFKKELFTENRELWIR